MYTDFNDGKISDLDNFLWEISNGIKKIAGNFTDFVRPLQNRRTLIKTSRELWSETVSPAEHPVAIQQEAATRCAMQSFSYLLLFVNLLAAVVGFTNLTDYTVLRIATTKETIKDDLRRLDERLGYQIDYLRQVRCLGYPAEMLVPDKDRQFVQQYLDQHGIANELITSNITQNLRRERRALMGPVEGEITFDLIQKKYLSFDDVSLSHLSKPLTAKAAQTWKLQVTL
ncbi:hypothetical protein Y032_0712g1742 [Ancylostoma ceylanicum]|uniref:Carboxypeptidase activation peptide domain-containing protein n=1 Tax=Ancylostoma ceylanicum TaxID=53326 RepID=A0A016WGX0_9BILA|nr:hypothetical protein Y032_0712g1742 [Ancylostoma ceylanicum]